MHLARGGHEHVVATSFCPSQRRRRYVSNETFNDVSVERRQDVPVVRLQDVIKERCDNVSRVRNNQVPLARLHYVSNQPQMKHLTMSWWYVAKTPQRYVSMMPYKNLVATSQRSLTATSQANPKSNTQWSVAPDLVQPVNLFTLQVLKEYENSSNKLCVFLFFLFFVTVQHIHTLVICSYIYKGTFH